MKKKNAIILVSVNAIYLALLFYVEGTFYPVDEAVRCLIALLFCVINAFIALGISEGVYD